MGVTPSHLAFSVFKLRADLEIRIGPAPLKVFEVSFFSTIANPPLCHSFHRLQLRIVLTAARALMRNAFGVLLVASNDNEYPTVEKETSGRCGGSR